MTEQLTADESAAMQAMAQDTAPVEAVEVVDVPQEEPAAPVAQAEPVAEPDKPPPGMVPQGALHQERERRKAAEQQFQALQAKLAEIEARLNPPAPEPEIHVPDPVLDPQGFRQFQIDQIRTRAAEKVAKEQEQALMTRLNHDVVSFKATVPDYDNAYQHAVQARRQELAFYGNSPEQVEAQMEVDVKAIVQQAYGQGRNPAELFYEYAKMRGYSAAPKAPAPQPQAAAQVTALAESQRQTQSLAPAGGPANDGGITIEALSKMSEAELAAMPKAKRDEAMRKVMGG
jgi:hypothetical protein